MPTQVPETILDALNFAELEVEDQQELMIELSDLIFKGTLVRLLERMSESQRDEFTALLERDAPEEEIEAYIDEHVKEADMAAAETIQELTDDILAITNK